jgi:hypothetical protein
MVNKDRIDQILEETQEQTPEVEVEVQHSTAQTAGEQEMAAPELL